MSDSIRPTRKNGLSRPYTFPQISTWVFLPTLVLEFLLVVSPILPLPASIPCTLLFVGLAVASVGYAYTAMKIDPSDPRLLYPNHKKDDETGGRKCSGMHWDPQDPTKQCWICDVQVGSKSMHCKFCNKCVDHFDHHCMWLNTCIGKANYKYFFRTLISINLMLFVQTAIQIAIILDIYLGAGATKEKAENWFAVGSTIPVVAIMGVFLFFDIGSLSLIGQLTLFHLKLQKEEISTYEYIVRDNQQRRERTKKLNELKLRRQTEIKAAKEEGQFCMVVRLKKGGLLREKFDISCCDPLPLDPDQSNNNDNGTKNNGAASNGHAVRNGEP